MDAHICPPSGQKHTVRGDREKRYRGGKLIPAFWFFKVILTNFIKNLTNGCDPTCRVIFKTVRTHTNHSTLLSLLLGSYMLLRDCLFQGSNTQILPNLENRQTCIEASRRQSDRSKNLFGNDQPTLYQTTSWNVLLNAWVTQANFRTYHLWLCGKLLG